MTDYRRRIAGISICFFLFILVFIFRNIKGFSFEPLVSSHRELSLLLFIFPGAISSCLLVDETILQPFLGAALAAPVCLLLKIFVFTLDVELLQQIAYLLSAVFWCVSGATFIQFFHFIFTYRLHMDD